MKSARTIEVIETVCARGSGEPDDPIREVFQYWTKDGELLAEKDFRYKGVSSCHGTLKN